MSSKPVSILICFVIASLCLTITQGKHHPKLTNEGILFPACDILGPHGQQDFIADFEGILLFEKFLAEQKARLFEVQSEKKDGCAFRSHYVANDDEHGQQCAVDIDTAIDAVRSRRRWAIEMLDASGKPASGLLQNNLGSLGDFDQCMDLDTGEAFDGRYCTAFFVVTEIYNVTFTTTVPFYIGFCLPSSCDSMDTESLINEYLGAHPNISAKAIDTSCRLRKIPLSSKAKVVISICSIFGFILVLATLYDILYQMIDKKGSDDPAHCLDRSRGQDMSEYKAIVECDSKNANSIFSHNEGVPKETCSKWDSLRQVLMPFSMYTNMTRLFSTRQPQDSIGCIHGLKVISMAWIILFHVFVEGLPTMRNREPYMNAAYEKLIFTFIPNSYPSVDTFFVISGLLLTYQVLKKLSKEDLRPQFFASFYLHRFWRLTPPYLLIMMTSVPLFKYLADGPLWPQRGVEKNECEATWWANVLYVNNFIKVADQCMSSTWYLACDFQFYIVSPLLFFPMLLYGWLGFLSPLVFLLSTAICSGVISNVYNLEVGKRLDVFLTPRNTDYEDFYLIKPYTRMGPFIVGTVAGYLLSRFQCNAQLPKWLVAVGWVASLATMMAIVFGVHDDVGGEPWSTDVAALYNSLSKIAWGICIGWIIFACANGYGGVINTFLSWKGFVLPSRLTYCTYLTHSLIIYWVFYSQRTYFYMRTLHLVLAYVGILCLSYAFAIMPYLAYEAPTVGLEKVIRGFVKRVKR